AEVFPPFASRPPVPPPPPVPPRPPVSTWEPNTPPVASPPSPSSPSEHASVKQRPVILVRAIRRTTRPSLSDEVTGVSLEHAAEPEGVSPPRARLGSEAEKTGWRGVLRRVTRRRREPLPSGMSS